MKFASILAASAALLLGVNAESKYVYNWVPSDAEKVSQYPVYQLKEGALRGPGSSGSVDLRSKCPPVYDQGQLGSCTANAIAGAFEFMQQSPGNSWTPSRLAIYYNERSIEGTVSTDSGAQVADGFKSLEDTGVCHESVWPYDISKFADEPVQGCLDEESNTKIPSSIVYSIADSNREAAVKQALDQGLPVVFGFTVYSSFEDQDVMSSGIMKMPAQGEKVLGGHAVMAVGYDDSKRYVLIRNSWGTSVYGSMEGYFWMPYDFIFGSDATDFWVIDGKTVNNDTPTVAPTSGSSSGSGSNPAPTPAPTSSGSSSGSSGSYSF